MTSKVLTQQVAHQIQF